MYSLREMRGFTAKSAVLCVLGVFAGCQGRPEAVAESSRDRLTIMTYNVENLFDTRDDPGRKDETFLPILNKENPAHKARCAEIKRRSRRQACLSWDWSEKTLRIKMSRLAGVILQVNQGRGPDILVLQEVENRAVLEQLREEFLGPAEYRPSILIEGGDIRGIDQAILSRLDPVGSPRLHQIPFSGMTARQRSAQRGVLEAVYRLPGEGTLSVFAVHLPAPYHPRRHTDRAGIQTPGRAPRFKFL